LEIWLRAIIAVEDFPITGIGLGAFGKVIPTLYPNFRTGDAVPHAHNLYLQVATDLGIPGLSGVLAIFIITGVLGIKGWFIWQKLGNWSMSWLTLGSIGAGCGIAMHGLFDAVSWGTKPAFISGMSLGLLLASGMVAQRQNYLAKEQETNIIKPMEGSDLYDSVTCAVKIKKAVKA
jgi:putative inorganic carbon (HCO3(-)) transporter